MKKTKIEVKITKDTAKSMARDFALFILAYIGVGTLFMLFWYAVFGDPFNRYTVAKAFGAGLGLAVGRAIILGVQWAVKLRKAWRNRTIINNNTEV